MNSCLHKGKKIPNLIVEKLIREACDNFYHEKDYELALEQVNKALNIDENNVKALVLKGNVLFCMDMDTEALDCFDKAIQNNPSSAEAYGYKAGILDMIGNPKEALDCCNKAFELIKKHNGYLLSSLFDQKLALLLRYKQYEEARKTLFNAMQLLSQEESSYLCSCYQGMIESSYKLRLKRLRQAEKLSLKVI